MIQKTLFDAPARLSRKSDPITSQQSAAETEKKLGPLHELFLQCLITLGRPSTANEVAELCSSINGKTCETNRKRAGELASEVYGRRIVVDGSRRCDVTGKPCRTFKLKGRT
jgi:hypothetical protein